MTPDEAQIEGVLYEGKPRDGAALLPADEVSGLDSVTATMFEDWWDIEGASCYAFIGEY